MTAESHSHEMEPMNGANNDVTDARVKKSQLSKEVSRAICTLLYEISVMNTTQPCFSYLNLQSLLLMNIPIHLYLASILMPALVSSGQSTS